MKNLGLRGVLLAVCMALVVTVATVPERTARAEKHQGPLAYPQPGPFIDIQVDSKENYEPAVAYSADRNEYLVVWQTEQDSSTWDIWARRVRADGIVQGPSPFCVATSEGKKRMQPAVAYNPVRDEYLVVYTYEFAGLDDDIMATVVGGDLSWKSSEYSISSPTDIQWSPEVAYNTQDDEYLVVWWNVWGDGRRDIYAQRLESDGSPFPGGPATIAADATELYSLPDVAYNEARNQYLIAYNYIASSLSTEGNVRGKVASADLSTLSSERHICDNTDNQGSLAVAAGPDEYLVTWTDENTTTGYYDIFARRLSGNGGTPVGPADGFPIAQFSFGSCYMPDVDYAWIYGYMVTWHGYSSTYLDDVYGHQVPVGSDAPRGLFFGVNGGMGSRQGTPAIACAPPGDCLVASEDNLDHTTWTQADYEIRGSFLLAWRQFVPSVLRNY